MPHVVSTRDTKVLSAHAPVAKQRRARKVAIPRRHIVVLARVLAAAYPGTGAVCVRAMPAGSCVTVQRADALAGRAARFLKNASLRMILHSTL